MGWISGTTQTKSTGATGLIQITVPSGVTTAYRGLWIFATADSTQWGFSVSDSANTPRFGHTVLDDRAAGNMRVTIVEVYGLRAGDVVTVTHSITAKTVFHTHVYSDQYKFGASPAVAVRGSSLATCTSGSFTPSAAGVKVGLISLERTLATPTTVSSVAVSTGESNTEVYYLEDTASNTTAASAYVGIHTAANTTARTAVVTYSSASGNGYAALFTVTAAPAQTGCPVKYVNGGGTLSDGGLWYADGAGGLVEPWEVRAVPTGYDSVTAMVAENPFYMAHRGGSANWPEGSMHAYTQSVYWGAGALEAPVQRTSDGVYVVCHDQTLDRTSGTVGFTISEHTWEEVAQYVIEPPAGSDSGPKPYIQLQDLLDTYGDTHVIFIDPKNLTGTQQLALLDLMDTYPNATSRFVWKYYGVSTTVAPRGTARGYKTWGYFYETDLAGFATYVPQWDYVGMEYGAAGATWTALAAYGKPMIGFIVETATQKAQCIAGGARGLQCSGVKAAIPRF